MGTSELAKRATPLATLQEKTPEARALISHWLVGRASIDNYAYLPITGGRFDAAVVVVVKRSTILPLHVLAIDRG